MVAAGRIVASIPFSSLFFSVADRRSLILARRSFFFWGGKTTGERIRLPPSGDAFGNPLSFSLRGQGRCRTPFQRASRRNGWDAFFPPKPRKLFRPNGRNRTIPPPLFKGIVRGALQGAGASTPFFFFLSSAKIRFDTDTR